MKYIIKNEAVPAHMAYLSSGNAAMPGAIAIGASGAVASGQGGEVLRGAGSKRV